MHYENNYAISNNTATHIKGHNQHCQQEAWLRT